MINYRFDAAGGTRSAQERAYLQDIGKTFEASPFSTLEKLLNFPLYVPRQNITTFLVRAHIFQQILGVHGSIVECGVGFGGGLMTWAHLSAIYEPTNHVRRVLGFDSFAGFPAVSEHDTGSSVGDLAVDSKVEIEKCITAYDMNRSVSHIPKVELIRGNAVDTIPEYLEKNPHLVVSLLYLDFDVYPGTFAAIQALRPRMPVGAIIAFDELAMKEWPGETAAVNDALGIEMLKLERCPWGSTICWARL